MSFHVKDNFQPGAPISQVPASWFNAVARLLNGLVGGNGITVVKNDFGPSVISLDNNEDVSRYVTLDTSQTITGAKVFTSSTTYDTPANATYGYLHFNFRGTLAGRIITAANTVHLRAYNGTAYSGIQLDHAGTNGTQRQLLKNEPSEDATSNSSTQIASRGWANKYFLRKSDYSAPDLSNYVTITGAQTITGAKKFANNTTFNHQYVNQVAGGDYIRYRFSAEAGGASSLVAEIIAGLASPALHLRVHNGNIYGGIVVASTTDGFAQRLVSGPIADETSTISTQIASRGWANGHFIRKSETSTGFAYNNAGAISYVDFGTTSGTVAAGDHTHSNYLTADDVGDAVLDAIADTQSSFLDDLVSALEAEFSNYVTLSGSQTITGAKTFTNTVQFNGSVGFTNFYYRNAQDADYSFATFKTNNVTTGYILSGTGTGAFTRMDAILNGSYNSLRLDFGGTNNEPRQRLEQEPSHDSGWEDSANKQIATRGFVYDKYAAKGHTHTLGDIKPVTSLSEPCLVAVNTNGMYFIKPIYYKMLGTIPDTATKLFTDKDTKANGGTLLTADDLDTTKVLTTDNLNPAEVLTTDDLDTNGGTIMTTTAGTKLTGNLAVATNIQWTGTVLRYTPVTLSFNNGICVSATTGAAVTIDTPTVVAWS